MTDQQLELFDECLQEGDPESLETIRRIRDKYQGVMITINRGAQSRQVVGWQKEETLRGTGAQSEAISISKRLFDRRVVKRVPSLKRVREIFGKINALKTNRRYTLPHPEPGVRLVRTGGPNLDLMSRFVREFESLQAELKEATEKLYYDWVKVREVAKEELGSLYDPVDYDFDPREAMTASIRFYEVDVPSYLQHNRELYQREARRVRAELELVKQMKEAELTEEIFQLVARLSERLQPRKLLDETHEVLEMETVGDEVRVIYQPSGTSKKSDRREAVIPKAELASRVKLDRRPKTFRDSTVSALIEGLQHAEEMLEELAIGGGKMQEAFDALRRLLGRSDAKAVSAMLRSSEVAREEIRNGLEQISETLLEAVVDKPRRAVLRRRRDQIHKRDN